MPKVVGFSLVSRIGVFASIAFTLVVLVLEPWAFGLEFENQAWFVFGFGLAAVLSGGLRHFAFALRELSARQVGQYSLGSFGLLLLVGLATWQSFVGESSAWLQAAAVVTLLSLGDWTFTQLKARVSGYSTDLLSLLPEYADVIVDKEITRVRASELEVGDIILVRPGSVAAADGFVVQGEGQLDESGITGEAALVAKSEGSFVYAGTVNRSSKRSNRAMTVRVSAVAGELFVERYTASIESLASERSKFDVFSRRLTGGLVILTIAAALIGSGMWLVLEPNSWELAVYSGAAVLVGVNLLMLSQVSVLINTLVASVAGASGFLVRARTALYRLRKSHVVVTNLVGTLTMGQLRLVEIHLAKGTSLGGVKEVLAVAAAANANSDHPLAKVILAEAERKRAPEVELYDLEKHSRGVSARMDGSEVLVGGPGILTMQNVPIDVQDLVKVATANEKGNSVVYVVIDNLLVGYLEFRDEIRETAREAVLQLQLQRKRVVVITGEAAGVTEVVCKSLGITEFHSEVVKERRLQLLEELRADRSIITVVGNQEDDAEALASADVGLALGVGWRLKSEVADFQVIGNEPRAVSRLILLAKSATRTATGIIALVTALNFAAIALAGFLASPALSAALVLVSTVFGGRLIWRLQR